MENLEKKETIFMVLAVVAAVLVFVTLFYQELGQRIIIIKDLWAYLLCVSGGLVCISFFYSIKIHFMKKAGCF